MKTRNIEIRLPNTSEEKLGFEMRSAMPATVHDVISGSQAWKAGLCKGQAILAVSIFNNFLFFTKKVLFEIFSLSFCLGKANKRGKGTS